MSIGRMVRAALVVSSIALAHPAWADAISDVRRADLLSLDKLSFLYSIPGFPSASTYSQKVDHVCLAKTPGTLDFTLNPADLGFPDLNIPIRFRGEAMRDGRIRWTADQPVSQCYGITLPDGARQRVFIGGTRAQMQTSAVSTGAVPTVDCGGQRHSLVAIQPDMTAGNQITFDANADCPPGLFGGPVGVFSFSFSGHFSVPAPPPPPVTPRLTSITLEPNHFCQYASARTAMKIGGRVGLDRAATAPLRVSLTATRGITITPPTVDIPAGATQASFTAVADPSFAGYGGITGAAGENHAYASLVMDIDPDAPGKDKECRAWSIPWVKVEVPPKVFKRPGPEPDPAFKKFINTLETVNSKAIIKATPNLALPTKAIQVKTLKVNKAVK